MYLPPHFSEHDPQVLTAFMRANPFATLVTAPNGVPFASHIPVLVDEEDGRVVIRSHLARANEQWQHFGEGSALVIFHGPHALVHPHWYGTGRAVPTWNYTVVHAHGTARPLGPDDSLDVARRLLAEFTPDVTTAPAEYVQRLLPGVVTFELHVTSLQGKFKLSQNRTADEQDRVTAALSRSAHPAERDTANFMQEHLTGGRDA